MYQNPTLEKLKQLRLNAMAELHLQNIQNNQSEKFTTDEYLALLVEHEWEHRHHQKVQRLLKQSAFKQEATIENIDYATQRNLDKNMFQRLTSLDFLKRNENIIITGASGLGKSYLAQAIGHQVCINTQKSTYEITSRLFNRFKLAKADGTYIRELKKLQRVDLLILDDFGLQSFDNQARETLMDIIEDRHEKASTIIASQLPVSVWYDIIGEGTIADAILDRVVNSSHRIDLKGESLRKRKKR